MLLGTLASPRRLLTSPTCAPQGVTRCLPEASTLRTVGDTFSIQFAVFDYSDPPLLSTVTRTVVITRKCATEEELCEDGTCSKVRTCPHNATPGQCSIPQCSRHLRAVHVPGTCTVH